MKISCISDIHIRSNEDLGMKTILSFFSNPLVLESDEVYLLGDIFDHLAGSFDEYFIYYSNFFNAILPLLQKGIKLRYVEGNHDVHLRLLFKNFLEKNSISQNQIIISNKGFSVQDSAVLMYFSHGDEYDKDNWTYKLWKSFLISRPVGLVIDKLVSFDRLNKISKKASDDSKKRNQNRDSESVIREKFRIGSLFRFKEGYSVVVGGHSHVKDHYIHKLESNEYKYINNGYPQIDRQFIYIKDGMAELENL